VKKIMGRREGKGRVGRKKKGNEKRGWGRGEDGERVKEMKRWEKGDGM
jgi:hypothetical protein